MSYFSLLDWRDYIEILSLSTAVYYFAFWLKNDGQKNLSIPFYLYISSFIGAHYLNLQVLSSLLLFSCPVILTIFILMHQKNLQKNFVVATRIDLDQRYKRDWIEELIKANLSAINYNKKIYFIIERRDSVSNLLYADWLIKAQFSKQLFEIFIQNNTQNINPDKNLETVWLNQEGILVAINAKWSFALDFENFESDSAIATSNTDAIIIKANPENRKFDVIADNKIYENLAASQLNIFLQKVVLNNIDNSNNKKESYYESINQNNEVSTYQQDNR